VGVLAQAEEPFALIGREALLDVVIAVAGGGEVAGTRPPEVERLLTEQLFTGVGPEEADTAGGVHLSGQRADGDPCTLPVDLDRRLGVRSFAQGPVAFDQIVEAGSHPQGVRTPRLDVDHLVT